MERRQAGGLEYAQGPDPQALLGCAHCLQSPLVDVLGAPARIVELPLGGPPGQGEYAEAPVEQVILDFRAPAKGGQVDGPRGRGHHEGQSPGPGGHSKGKRGGDLISSRRRAERPLLGGAAAQGVVQALAHPPGGVARLLEACGQGPDRSGQLRNLGLGSGQRALSALGSKRPLGSPASGATVRPNLTHPLSGWG